MEHLPIRHVSDPQSWNLFVYVRKNPILFTDPDGKECVERRPGRLLFRDSARE
jgi:hypothetical protein